MIPAAIAGIASVAGSAISKSNQDKPEPVDNFGIESTMNGNQQNTAIANSSTEGSQNGSLMKDMASSAFKQGFNAVMGHATSSAFSKSASQQGSDQRDYLAAAFPEMNPWERAGASATQQGVAMADNKQKQSMLSQQIEGQKDVARIQGDNQVRVAEIQSGTSKYGADTAARASGYSADTSANASRYSVDINAGNVEKQIAALQKKVQADTKLALEKAKTESEAKSVVGGIAKDAVNAIERIRSHPIDIRKGSFTDNFIKNDLPKIKASFTQFADDATKWINLKFKRDSAAGVQSGFDASTQREYDSKNDGTNYPPIKVRDNYKLRN